MKDWKEEFKERMLIIYGMMHIDDVRGRDEEEGLLITFVSDLLKKLQIKAIDDKIELLAEIAIDGEAGKVIGVQYISLLADSAKLCSAQEMINKIKDI